MWMEKLGLFFFAVHLQGNHCCYSFHLCFISFQKKYNNLVLNFTQCSYGNEILLQNEGGLEGPKTYYL